MKILNIAGARPNFMKIAPLMSAMHAHPSVLPILVHTGQHYDVSMSKVFFEELGIPTPNVNLEVGSGTREEQIERIMERFEPVVEDERPDAVLVVGDVNSTIACARIAVKHGIKVVHVEAGLRSFDRDMPEEINRVETDQLSDLLFVTESSGMTNLANERVAGKAFLVGNVMIDTLARNLDKCRALNVRERFGLKAKSYFVGTFHRPSNVDAADNLRRVVDIIEYTAEHSAIVLPLHPRTRKSLEEHGWLDELAAHENVHLCDPLGYLEFISLVSDARGIVTDSGGVQEETTFLQIPCVTMRDNTERPATVEVGTNVLAGTFPGAVIKAVDDILQGRCKAAGIPELWDGHAAERIVDLIVNELS